MNKKKLSLFSSGSVGTVVDYAQSPEVKKFFSLGLTPGKTIRIVTDSPAFIVQIDYSYIALDQELADLIWVREQ
jgi:Fe2+ transport system protein FeoA